jgi:hypothetical protein
MELTTLIMLWVLVTTAVIVLAYMRMMFGMHDLLQVHFSGDRPPVDPREVKMSSRVRTLDKVGIPLTVVSALLALAIGLVWAIQEAGPG